MAIHLSSVTGSSPTPEGENPALRHLQVLWKRKWAVLALAGLGCAAAYGWTLGQPRIYQAATSIEYDPNPPRPLGRAVEDLASPVPTWWETREYFATQNKIIASRAVAERVVRKLSLQHNPDFNDIPQERRKKWKGASLTDTAERLRSMLTVTQERDTRLVHIQVKDTDAKRAMLLSNSIARAYIEKTMEDRLGVTTSALQWLGEQLDTLKQGLESAEIALHEFTEENSNLAVSLDDQQNIVASSLDQLSTQLNQTKVRRVELSARLTQLKAANDTDALKVFASPILSNPAVSQLRERYRTLLAERGALVVTLGDAHPKVVAIHSQLDTVQRELRAEVDGLIASAQSDLSEIEGVEKGAQQAFDAANKLGVELNLQEITYRRLQRERDNTAKLYGTILERTAQTDLTRALEVSYVRVVDAALVPRIPVSPRVTLSLAVGGLLGLLFGIGLAMTLEQLDRVIRTIEDAEALGITMLGILPKIAEGMPAESPAYAKKARGRKQGPALVGDRDLVVHTHPKSSVAECCRTVRTNLMFMAADRPHRAIVVTSPNPREGKTTVTMSLAISLAQSGKRVLVVDTDLRKPRVHKALGRSNHQGVTTVLVGQHTLKEALQQTEIPSLDLLASGPIPPNPAELLHTSQFRDLVSELARRYDHVLFDSPPLAAVTDAAVIAPQVDGVILVVHGQKTTREALRAALRQLHDVSAHLTGGVLNEVDLSSGQYGYGAYYYQRGSYYEASEADRRTDAPAAEA